MREMENFILELGVGFTFVARQKRITLDGDDFYLDLLFYHRRLRRLVGIELKFDEFKPGDKGQMELYLRWLAKHETQPGEDTPIGLILCAGKKEETVELLEPGKDGIHVASYWTKLLPKAQLERKLHQAVLLARATWPGAHSSHDRRQQMTTLKPKMKSDTCRKYVVPICLGGGGSLFCGLQTLAFSLQPLDLISVLGKFGGADQLRNAVNQLQSLLYTT